MISNVEPLLGIIFAVLILGEHVSVLQGVGIALVLVGTACLILGAIQHRSYVSTLAPTDVPRSHDPRYPIALAIFLAALGFALVAYLAI